MSGSYLPDKTVQTHDPDLVETIPDLFDAVFWNADSGVFDGNKDFLIFFGRLDRDCGVCEAEFERIVDQVIKYLLDLAEISGDKQGFAA